MAGVVKSGTHYPGPRKHRGRLVPIARVLLGRPYDGHPRTNASWGKPGTGHYDPDSAGWWAHQSYRRRMGIVWSVLLAPVVSVYGYVVAPEATVSAQREAAWIAIAALLWVTVHRTRRWKPYKQYLEPVHLAIHQDLEIPRKLSPRAYISAPRNGEHLFDPDRPIVVTLPDGFNLPEGPRRAKLAHKVAEAGGIMANGGQFQAEFVMDALPKSLVVSCNPQPDELVTFDRIVDHWRAAADDEIVFGLSHTAAPVKKSLNMDAPHILLSVGPGGGKTELAAAVALQRIARGALIYYVDIAKRGISAKWAKYLDEVVTIRQVEEAYKVILEVYEEVQRRGDTSYHDDTGTYDPREIWLILDEAPQSFVELRKYERKLRRDDKDAPSAVDAYEGIGRLGREPRIHLMTIAQRASHRATGGGDIRESHGIIVGGRGIRANTARMLFEGVGDALPRFSDHPGRYQVASGGSIDELQGALLIGPKPRKQLLEEPAKFLQESRAAGVAGPRREQVDAAPSASSGAVAVAEPKVIEAELIDNSPVEPEVVDLREAADKLHAKGYAITHEALKNYRGKPETRVEFNRAYVKTVEGAYHYDLSLLARFLDNRPRRKGD